MEEMMPSLDQARLHLMHRYWNAANYLAIGQIYLQANPQAASTGDAGGPNGYWRWHIKEKWYLPRPGTSLG
jgi:phosphoketolase